MRCLRNNLHAEYHLRHRVAVRDTQSLSDQQPVSFPSSTRSEAETSLGLAPAIRTTWRRSWTQKWCCEIHRHSRWPLNRAIFPVYGTNASQETEDERNPNAENRYFKSSTLTSFGSLVILCSPISLLYSLIMIGLWLDLILFKKKKLWLLKK